MDQHRIYRKLSQKLPLIYEVEGDYYFLGKHTFQKCSEDQVELYRVLKQQLARLRGVFDDLSMLTERDVKVVKETYVKIYNTYAYTDTGENGNTADRCMWEMIRALSDEEIRSLDAQMDEYITVMNLADGCFYRESAIYKEGKGR